MAIKKDSHIHIAGHRGMVGSAIRRELEGQGYHNIICRTHAELDLTDQAAVNAFYAENQLDCVIIAAAKVGGIHANNTYPAEFIYQNMMMEANLIHGAKQAGIQDLLFLGSSCIYPRNAAQPMKEEALLTGPLEPTNEPYAIAKIAGIKLCESYNRQHGTDYRSLMPTNLYGPGDNFHPENSHVIPGLIRRFHESKTANADSITCWGSGTPRREFLYVEDLATACVHILKMSRSTFWAAVDPRCSHINVGTGDDQTIRELAELIAEVTGFSGKIIWDTEKPDGTPQKLLDVSKLNNMQWRASMSLNDGLKNAYKWFLANEKPQLE